MNRVPVGPSVADGTVHPTLIGGEAVPVPVSPSAGSLTPERSGNFGVPLMGEADPAGYNLAPVRQENPCVLPSSSNSVHDTLTAKKSCWRAASTHFSGFHEESFFPVAAPPPSDQRALTAATLMSAPPGFEHVRSETPDTSHDQEHEQLLLHLQRRLLLQWGKEKCNSIWPAKLSTAEENSNPLTPCTHAVIQSLLPIDLLLGDSDAAHCNNPGETEPAALQAGKVDSIREDDRHLLDARSLFSGALAGMRAQTESHHAEKTVRDPIWTEPLHQ